VSVYGCPVQPGQLIHADKHGFVTIPEDDEPGLLEAARFMDSNECRTVIAAARSSQGKTTEEILQAIGQAGQEFSLNAKKQFGGKGEW
jgi:regulator of RNase E activity RraA